ncbi:DNA polymerase IV [Caldithrix abyssi DSM 13497]|uniref:DNA polymerase IV n=1 Tax=Caldithrix abyssi DSM 13497 TaxID=880073 RepID=H1XUV2_CALAY|nr:DNA polymerase IV [Caldithrix abyssi]APF17555.1 dinB DNA polymerase-4 [Caldithrix abyssi DSM 13497]EHO41651.1 DNA polymerase IV [Caldithrix abyssi DSM 13497]
MAEQTVIMHIDADAFFASVEQGFNPRLRGKPVIVGGLENQRGVVHTASYEARACGVRTGMPLFRARALCPQAVFLKGNYEHYRAVSEVFREVYLKYTPEVEFTSLDDAYLNLTGAMHLYPSARRVAEEIKAEVWRRVGVSLSVGIGSNKVIARIASGLKKPGGVVEVPAGKEREFLAGLPVDALPGIGPMAREKLFDLGIFKVGQLARLPKGIMEQLFGKNGIKIWHFARGEDDRPVAAKIFPKQISRETSFEEDTADLELVRGTLQYLCERIGKKLRSEELTCRALAIKIKYSDFKFHTASARLPFATNNGNELDKIARQLFEQIRLRRTRIRHVGVSVSHIEALNYQLTLFNDKTRREVLDAAIDEIRERFGFMAILPADTLQLRRKYRMEPNGYILHNPALTR